MRIDSGQSNYYYQSRFLHIETDSEEAVSDAATTPKWRGGSSVSVSSALLSSSLANALWGIEGDKKTDAAQASAKTEKTAPASAAAQIEALYLENSTTNDE